MAVAIAENTEHQHPQIWVAYYNHETDPDHTAELADTHFADLAAHGFTHVIFCVTENDIASPRRLAERRRDVAAMHQQGLEVIADPWGLASVFGGKHEAASPFTAAGEKCCAACNPKVYILSSTWVQAVAEIGADAIFLDEPEMQCTDHDDGEADFEFVRVITKYAGTLGLPAVVCLCANANKIELFRGVAALENVTNIGVDPYLPNPWDKAVTRTNFVEYVRRWFRFVAVVAAEAGVETHGWGQFFGAEADPRMPAEVMQAGRDVGMHAVAYWAYEANRALPRFRIEDGEERQVALWASAVHTARQARMQPTSGIQQ